MKRLNDLPIPAKEIIAALPKGWLYIGARDTQYGCRWEASSPLGVASAQSPGKLIHMCETANRVRDGMTTISEANIDGEFNRRRKPVRRASRENTLKRCVFPDCGSLVFPEQQVAHLKDFHPNYNAPLDIAYEEPQDNPEEDGTADNPAQDDPEYAMAVEAEL